MTSPGKMRLKRFTVVQRLFHLGLMLAFVIQATTGLARLYAQTSWGKGLTSLLGGPDQVLGIHKVVGVLLITLFAGHVLYALTRIKWTQFPARLFQPDSLIPQPADIGQFIRHTLWLAGLAPPPQFDRWTYWEKFDYWAVFWGMVIIGGSGVILYDPVATSRIMPGWSINLALWVHRIEAILAMGHVFIIHFFIAHFRRHSFPMDTVIFEGSMDLDEARHERPAWVARLEASGTIAQETVSAAAWPWRIVYYGFGLTVVAFCLYLLISGLVNAGHLTW